jgi:hypothetical protein
MLSCLSTANDIVTVLWIFQMETNEAKRNDKKAKYETENGVLMI